MCEIFHIRPGNTSMWSGWPYLGLEWVRMTPKWINPGIFSDQISVHFGAPRQNVLKSDLKKFPDFKMYWKLIWKKNRGFVPFGANLDPLCAQTWPRCAWLQEQQISSDTTQLNQASKLSRDTRFVPDRNSRQGNAARAGRSRHKYWVRLQFYPKWDRSRSFF